MSRKLTFFLIIISIYSCQNNDSKNIKSVVSNDIVGDFDREKYPLIQKAIELGFEGKQEEAIAKFDEAQKVYGESVIISLNRGIIYKELNELNLAVKDYTLCLKLNPNYYPALINRGIVNGYLNNYSQAINDLNRAILLNSKHPIGYINRAMIYSMMNKKDLACDDLTRAKEKDFNNDYSKGINELVEENCE